MRAWQWSQSRPRCRSQRDDLTNSAAVGEAVEAFVELVEHDVLAQQTIDRQASSTIQLDVARNVARGIAAAQITAFDRALLGDDAHVRNREQVLRVRQAGRHSRAAAP